MLHSNSVLLTPSSHPLLLLPQLASCNVPQTHSTLQLFLHPTLNNIWKQLKIEGKWALFVFLISFPVFIFCVHQCLSVLILLPENIHHFLKHWSAGHDFFLTLICWKSLFFFLYFQKILLLSIAVYPGWQVSPFGPWRMPLHHPLTYMCQRRGVLSLMSVCFCVSCGFLSASRVSCSVFSSLHRIGLDGNFSANLFALVFNLMDGKWIFIADW